MSRFFSLRLALNNIKNNRKFYLPYTLAAVGIIAMFYIICYLAMNPGVSEMSSSLSVIMGFGVFVMALFSFIFLFYTNSFLMKRRKKEIGLYNILGMEKRHIGKILMIESLMISLTSIVFGLFCGVLFSKLVYLILSWVFGTQPPFGIDIIPGALVYTAVLFGVLFALTTVSNQMSIHLAKPIELLYGGNVGEKEPKSRGILAVFGFICLAAGYAIAITTESPLTAITLFFVAVVLVIVGTYCLFTAGSVAILKALRKNKKFYYKPGNFTAVSGLLYRMKQNAVGLANICILSTMVLVMISGTVSLYAGMGDSIDKQVPRDVSLSFTTEDAKLDQKKVEQFITDRAKQDGLKVTETDCMEYLAFMTVVHGSSFQFEQGDTANLKAGNMFIVFTAEQYERLTGEKLQLEKGEAAAYSRGYLPEKFTIGDTGFTLKKTLERFTSIQAIDADMTDHHYLVVSDDSVLMDLYRQQRAYYGDNASGIEYRFDIAITGTDQQKIDYSDHLEDDIGASGAFDFLIMWTDTRVETTESYYGLVGGFLFLGIFLGIVFTFAAALIIYYKQISEGYYDKGKFEIMQKVGMSKQEVKQVIRKQVLMVFFAPLIMAGIHVLAAFRMITKLLLVFGMTNTPLFAFCTLCTFLLFAVIYALVYVITAREYYKIVG